MKYIGQNIQLTGKSPKGKNKVREYGSLWVVVAETDRTAKVATTSKVDTSCPGHWLNVIPSGHLITSDASMWISAESDDHFTIAILG